MTAISSHARRKPTLIALAALTASAAIALSIQGCSRRKSAAPAAEPNKPVATAGEPLPTAAPAERPAAARREKPLKPVLSLSANDTTDCQVASGWPVTFMVVLSHPARFGAGQGSPPVVLGSTEKPWLDSLQLVVRDSQGKPGRQVDWKMTRVRFEPAGRLELSGQTTGRAMWRLASQDSAKLAQGVYSVCALLKTEAGEVVESRPAIVRIAQEPAGLSAADKARKCQLLMRESMDRKDWAAASAQIDSFLADQPEDVGGWELKGDLLAQQGKPREAMTAYDTAVAAYAKMAKDSYDEPSQALMAKRRTLINQLLTKDK